MVTSGHWLYPTKGKTKKPSAQKDFAHLGLFRGQEQKRCSPTPSKKCLETVVELFMIIAVFLQEKGLGDEIPVIGLIVKIVAKASQIWRASLLTNINLSFHFFWPPVVEQHNAILGHFLKIDIVPVRRFFSCS